MGLDESAEDRIDMAFTLRDLEIKSVPVNMLNPIPGTPFEHNPVLTQDDMLTTAGITTKTDLELLDELGYETRLYNG